MSRRLALAATVAAAIMAAPAGAAVIDSYDNGSYNHNGIHSGGNTNTFTGVSGSFPSTAEYRSFYAFDLAGQAQASAISVTFLAHGFFYTDTGSETFGIYDYLGSVDELVGGASNFIVGLPRYTDLGSGALLGQHTMTAATGTAMPEITVALSSAFVDLYNAALLGDQKIALGVALMDFDFWGGNQGFWGSASLLPSARLNVTGLDGPDPTQVSAPATLGLMGLGLIALAGLRRRKD